MAQAPDRSAGVGDLKLRNLDKLKDRIGSGTLPAAPAIPQALREAVLGDDPEPAANERRKPKKKAAKKPAIENPAQFNVATDQRNKDRAAMWKAMHKKSFHQILTEAFDLYEKKHGKVGQ